MAGSCSMRVALTDANTYNLTSLGTADWVAYPGASPVRKSGGGNQIVVGHVGSFTDGTANSANGAVTWSDGAGTVSGTSQNLIISPAGSGTGYSVTLPADTSQRTAYIIFGVWGSNMRITATLSDGTPALIDDSLTWSSGGGLQALVTVTYAAASAAQTLTVTGVMTSSGSSQNAAFQGAALAAVTHSTSSYVQGTSQMPYADRLQFASSSTSAASITVSGAVSGFRTLAKAISEDAGKLNAITVGAKNVRFVVLDTSGNWEAGLYTITSATQIDQTQRVSSSNGGQAAVFSGALTVYNDVLAADLARMNIDTVVPFSQSIPLVQPGTAYMPQTNVGGVLAFTPAANLVQGAQAVLRLVADGVNTPTFSGFKEAGGSLGYQNTAGIVNVIQFFYDGLDAWYWALQEINAQPVAVAATGLSLTGPSTGVVSTSSSAFTVGITPTNGTLSGSVTVTPSDGGAGGVFTPTSVTLTSSATSQTFTYKPSSAGAKTISITNNGGLSNPTSLTYTATAVAAPLRFASLTRAVESGTGPYTYTGSGAGSGFGTTEGDAVLTTAFQNGVDGELVVKCLTTPSNSTNELIYGVDPSNATGKLYYQLAYGMVGHAGNYDKFEGNTYDGNVTSVGTAAGHYVRIRRAGSTLTMMYSTDNGATYNAAASWTGVSTGVLYLHILVTGTGSWTPISSSGLA